MCGLGKRIVSLVSRTTKGKPTSENPPNRPANDTRRSKTSDITTLAANNDKESTAGVVSTNPQSAAAAGITDDRPRNLADLPPELQLPIMEYLGPATSVCAGLTCRSLWFAHRTFHRAPIPLDTCDETFIYLTPGGFIITVSNELGRLLRHWGPLRGSNIVGGQSIRISGHGVRRLLTQ